MTESKKYIDLSNDICKIFKKTRGADILIPFAFKFIEKFGKIPKRCPIKEGEYYMYNATLKGFPISDIPFMNYYSTQSQDTFVSITATVKLKGKLIPVFNITMAGGYRYE